MAATKTVTAPRLHSGDLLARWRYRGEGRRDVRLDLLRGYAVFAMICDHASGISWFSPITGGNRFVVSAAEGFVFLAGLVIGMVYGGRMRRDGWLAAAESILRRALILYAATVGLTLLFVALFQFTSLKLWLDRSYGLGLTDPVELVVGTLTLHYTYHGTDILWMYTILIATAPLILLLLRKGQVVVVLAGSWALWLAYQFFPNQAAIPWVATNVNYFPVAAWQVIFVNGLAIGYHRDAVARVLGRVPTGLALVGFGLGLSFLILVQRARDTGQLAGWPVVGRLAGELYLTVFDKPTLALGRLLAFVILAGFAYSLTTAFWTPLRRSLGWLLLPLGTSSLRAYGIHLLVIVGVYNIDFLARLYDRSRTGNTIIQAVTVGVTFAAVVAWRRAEAGVEWRPSLPPWPARLERRGAWIMAGSLVAVALTVSGAIVAGPVRAIRQADPASAPAEAGVLRDVPPDAAAHGAPLTVLLALHDEDEGGPEFAAPLVDLARANGWSVIAPTIPYRDRSDPRQVAADAAEALPGLRQLLEGLDERAEVQLRPRVLILGSGRGALTARQFALFYPELVAAVASIGPAPCTMPAAELRTGSDETRLPFPFGVDDLEQYVGRELDEEALRQTAFWIGVRPAGSSPIDECPWGPLAGRDPPARAQVFAEALARIGARTHIVVFPESVTTATALSQAAAFLQENDPKAER